jgi:hypothetical protein
MRRAVFQERASEASRMDSYWFALDGGSANAITFPSGSRTFTWRTPFE